MKGMAEHKSAQDESFHTLEELTLNCTGFDEPADVNKNSIGGEQQDAQNFGEPPRPFVDMARSYQERGYPMGVGPSLQQLYGKMPVYAPDGQQARDAPMSMCSTPLRSGMTPLKDENKKAPRGRVTVQPQDLEFLMLHPHIQE